MIFFQHDYLRTEECKVTENFSSSAIKINDSIIGVNSKLNSRLSVQCSLPAGSAKHFKKKNFHSLVKLNHMLQHSHSLLMFNAHYALMFTWSNLYTFERKEIRFTKSGFNSLKRFGDHGKKKAKIWRKCFISNWRQLFIDIWIRNLIFLVYVHSNITHYKLNI